MVPLACTVRGCGLALERRERVFVCVRGHSYDVARSGYVNLLQPQDRRSVSPGDAKEALDARARLADAGVGRALLATIVEQASALSIAPAVAVDLGSGTGEAIAALLRALPIAAIGIDLSAAAAEMAARRFAALTSAAWVVANADRRLPLLDDSVGLVLSVHGRRNPQECARVISPHGHLLVAVPAADDLVELRAAVQGERIERDRADVLIDAHTPAFRLIDRGTVRERRLLTRDLVLDLLRGTYRGERRALEARVASLDTMEVTTASEWMLLAPKSG